MAETLAACSDQKMAGKMVVAMVVQMGTHMAVQKDNSRVWTKGDPMAEQMVGSWVELKADQTADWKVGPWVEQRVAL